MSNNLDLSQVAAGQSQKEVTINDQAGELDAALTETIDLDFTSGNVTLTAAQMREYFQFVATNLSVARDLTVLAQKRFFFVDNSAGTDALSVILGSTTIVIATLTNGIFYTDGTANGLVQVGGGSGGGNTDELDWKPSVVAASTANGTLATAFENGDTMDGVTLATGDRILLKDQTAGEENGIRIVQATGVPTRATDADGATEINAGMACYVEEGTLNKERIYFLVTTGAIVVDTTALVFKGLHLAARLELGGFVGGVPAVSTIIFRHLAADAIDFLADLAGAVGHAGTGPDTQTDFDVQVNGVSKATIRFAISGTVATFPTASAFSLVAGDRLDVVTPADLNLLADFSFTLVAARG